MDIPRTAVFFVSTGARQPVHLALKAGLLILCLLLTCLGNANTAPESATPAVPTVFEGLVPAQEISALDVSAIPRQNEPKRPSLELLFHRSTGSGSISVTICESPQEAVQVLHNRMMMVPAGPNWNPRESKGKTGRDALMEGIPSIEKFEDSANGWNYANGMGGHINFRSGRAVVTTGGEMAFEEIVAISRSVFEKLTPKEVDHAEKQINAWLEYMADGDVVQRVNIWPSGQKNIGSMAVPEMVASLNGSLDDDRVIGGEPYQPDKNLMGGKLFSKKRYDLLGALKTRKAPKARELAVPAYIAHLDPKYCDELRAKAMEGLGESSDPRALEALKNFLNAPLTSPKPEHFGAEARMRLFAIVKLAHFNDPSVPPFLEEVAARAQENTLVKKQAQKVLKQLKETGVSQNDPTWPWLPK
jgi:hypothetical protein